MTSLNVLHCTRFIIKDINASNGTKKEDFCTPLTGHTTELDVPAVTEGFI